MKKTIVLIDYENVQKHDLRPLLEHDVLIKVFHGENQKFTSDFMRLALDFGKGKFELIQIKGQGKNAADFHIAYFIGKLAKEIPEASFHIISKDTGFKVLADFLNQKQGIFCRVESSIAEMPLLEPHRLESVARTSAFGSLSRKILVRHPRPLRRFEAPDEGEVPAGVVAEGPRQIGEPALRAKWMKQAAPVVKPVVAAVVPRRQVPAMRQPKTNEDWYALFVRKLINSKAQKPKKKKTLRNQIISICKRKINENDADAIIQKLVENKVIECQNESIIYS
jgi:hypothetical protein